ncbi:NADPH:quinone reductase [Chryseobacterium arachidis]|uniref:NADPH:quinone reductase n=2 Tax=Chryseobacterium arachidis TaxID=1416778 RepID=A0A1M5KL18_9FLAO|nr:zinc-binding alcohol dehydrogenase family protein [Chryseobacterium arachidis]SHG53487.1 NADPH:quinone reductase [Chryseobacterium arachidis]
MKTVEFTIPGNYEVLKIVDRPIPDLLEGQLLVRITLAAVNAVDNTVRSGKFTGRHTPVILGNEGVGIVIKGNSDFTEGTRVMISCFTEGGQIRGIYTNGLWAEYIAVYPDELIILNDSISDEEAAAFPVSFFSAQACLNKAEFQPGKSVLSLAVGGGVGNAAVQLATVLGASQVITTAGSTQKYEKALLYGFQNVIDLSKESISDGVMRITEGKGVDIVIDSIGGNLTGEAIKSLSRNGILVTIGYSAGTTFSANITDFVWKGLQMRGQSLNGWFDRDAEKEIWNQLMPLLEDAKLKPLIAKVYDAEEVAEAQRFLIEERPFGKVLIKF